MKVKFFMTYLLVGSVFLSSCESEVERKQRVAREEQQRIELAEKRIQEEEARELRQEQERIEQEAKLEKERQEKAIYDKYIENSLNTGNTPYSYCFGRNNSCSGNYCSQIKVKTPNNSDVLVTIKKNNNVYRHAYIKANSSYTFDFPNGSYQTFFYYGKGWNPDKVMKETDCGTLKGGFVSDETFGKDDPQTLNNNILEYSLVLQQSGNFTTRPSNPGEAF